MGESQTDGRVKEHLLPAPTHAYMHAYINPQKTRSRLRPLRIACSSDSESERRHRIQEGRESAFAFGDPEGR